MLLEIANLTEEQEISLKLWRQIRHVNLISPLPTFLQTVKATEPSIQC